MRARSLRSTRRVNTSFWRRWLEECMLCWSSTSDRRELPSSKAYVDVGCWKFTDIQFTIHSRRWEGAKHRRGVHIYNKCRAQSPQDLEANMRCDDIHLAKSVVLPASSAKLWVHSPPCSNTSNWPIRFALPKLLRLRPKSGKMVVGEQRGMISTWPSVSIAASVRRAVL